MSDTREEFMPSDVSMSIPEIEARADLRLTMYQHILARYNEMMEELNYFRDLFDNRENYEFSMYDDMEYFNEEKYIEDMKKMEHDLVELSNLADHDEELITYKQNHPTGSGKYIKRK